MTEQKVIEKTICLEPKFLDKNIKQHLYDKLKEEFLDKCDQKYGYIIKIYENMSILDNSISPAGLGIFFKVKFAVKTLMPEINKIYEGKACMILVHGIIVEIASHLKVFIPTTKLEGFTYNKKKDCYEGPKGRTISKGDKVKLKIELIKYEKPTFSCLGKLV